MNRNKGIFVKEKGITLIALVITIILLLILAGISITFLMGDGGIITKVHNSKMENEKSEFVEQLKLVVGGEIIEKEGYNNEISLKQLVIDECENKKDQIKIKDEDGILTSANNENDICKNSDIHLEDNQIMVVHKNGYVYVLTLFENNVSYEYVGKWGKKFPTLEVQSKNPLKVTISAYIDSGEIKALQIKKGNLDIPCDQNIIENGVIDNKEIDLTESGSGEYIFIVTTEDGQKTVKTLELVNYNIIDKVSPSICSELKVIDPIQHEEGAYLDANNNPIEVEVTSGEDNTNGSGVAYIGYTITVEGTESEEIKIINENKESSFKGKIELTKHGENIIKAYTYDNAGNRSEDFLEKIIYICSQHENDEKIITNATCEDKGSKIITCKYCKKYDQVDIDPLGHLIPEEYETDESNHWKSCERECGKTIESEEAHSGGTATCTTLAKCTKCNKSYGSINSSNHTGTKKSGTCTSYTWSCCNASGGKSSHSYKYTTIKEPTCTAKGSRKYTCSNGCGSSYTSDVAALNHKYSTSWSRSSTQHWKACTRSGCTSKSNVGNHVYASGSICGTCGGSK